MPPAAQFPSGERPAQGDLLAATGEALGQRACRITSLAPKQVWALSPIAQAGAADPIKSRADLPFSSRKGEGNDLHRARCLVDRKGRALGQRALAALVQTSKTREENDEQLA